MNKFFSIFTLTLSLVLTIPMVAFNFANSREAKEMPVKVSFIIKNDTGSSVRLYDGKGYFSIGSTSSKKVNVNAGRKYYKGERGRKGEFLFEVDAGFLGKTVKLSYYY